MHHVVYHRISLDALSREGGNNPEKAIRSDVDLQDLVGRGYTIGACVPVQEQEGQALILLLVRGRRLPSAGAMVGIGLGMVGGISALVVAILAAFR